MRPLTMHELNDMMPYTPDYSSLQLERGTPAVFKMLQLCVENPKLQCVVEITEPYAASASGTTTRLRLDTISWEPTGNGGAASAAKIRAQFADHRKFIASNDTCSCKQDISDSEPSSNSDDESHREPDDFVHEIRITGDTRPSAADCAPDCNSRGYKVLHTISTAKITGCALLCK